MTVSWAELIRQNGFLIMDGASGTNILAAGLPPGENPERWILENPSVLVELQTSYLEAGSQLLYTFTFGANRIKQEAAGLEISVSDLNRRLASITVEVKESWQKKHAGRPVLVAGDLAPTGLFLEPLGPLSFTDLIDIYREQVKGLLEAGVDLFVIETMMDLAQTRAAVMAVRKECTLPVISSLTVEENGRTLSGESPSICLLTLAGLGIDAFGLNCSAGPAALSKHLKDLLSWSPLPLMIKPNAGLPRIIAGQTVFPMGPLDFAGELIPAMQAGVRLFGGCCGTGPAHIRALKDKLSTYWSPPAVSSTALDHNSWICSTRHLLDTKQDFSCVTIAADDDDLLDSCFKAQDDGNDALILDYSRADSAAGLRYRRQLTELCSLFTLPLIFRCQDLSLLSTLLKHYHGRAGVQSTVQDIPCGALRL